RADVPALIDALKDARRPAWRANAARGLWGIGPDGADAARDLARLMAEDPSDEVREACAVALGRMGAAAGDQLDRLRAVAADAKAPPAVRVGAVEALGGLGKVAQPAVRDLSRAAAGDEPVLRLPAARAVRRIA